MEVLRTSFGEPSEFHRINPLVLHPSRIIPLVFFNFSNYLAIKQL